MVDSQWSMVDGRWSIRGTIRSDGIDTSSSIVQGELQGELQDELTSTSSSTVEGERWELMSSTQGWELMFPQEFHN